MREEADKEEADLNYDELLIQRISVKRERKRGTRMGVFIALPAKTERRETKEGFFLPSSLPFSGILISWLLLLLLLRHHAYVELTHFCVLTHTPFWHQRKLLAQERRQR